MTTPKAKLAGLALIAALCVGFISGLTAPARAGLDEGVAAYIRGDYATAIREWRPLAKQGNAKAQFNLGRMYRFGWGVPQDNAKAAEWYRKAAEQGYAKAQFKLGFMYDDGLGVPQDYVQAHMWFTLSLLDSPPGEHKHTGDYRHMSVESRHMSVKSRDIIAKMMTPAQISEAQKLAREWKAK